MFNLNKSDDSSNNNDKGLKLKWLNFLSGRENDDMLNSIASETKFAAEDLRIRALVKDTLEKEFGKKITQIKNFDYLVDSVVNKLKENQLKASMPDEKE